MLHERYAPEWLSYQNLSSHSKTIDSPESLPFAAKHFMATMSPVVSYRPISEMFVPFSSVLESVQVYRTSVSLMTSYLSIFFRKTSLLS